MNKNKKWGYPIFLAIKWTVWLFHAKMKVYGKANLPENEAVILVGNHSHMSGPICSEIYLKNSLTWCAGEMMNTPDVPAYAYRDFWAEKPKPLRPFYKALSYIIAPISDFVFNRADTIPVYHDSRILTTFRTTMSALNEGQSIVIFPEHDKPRNNIICDFQDKFIDIARLYAARYGKELMFVPIYIAPRLNGIFIGEGVRYNKDSEPSEERARICEYLMEGVTAIARSLPEHTVLPYKNVAKRYYPKNTDYEREVTNEKARG